MKTTIRWMSLSLFVTFSATAQAASPIEVGSAWFMKAVKGEEATAPTKEAPLEFVLDAAERSCRGVRSGTAKDKKKLVKVQKCLREVYTNLAAEGESVKAMEAWKEVPLNDLLDTLEGKAATKAKGVAAERKVIFGRFDAGQGVDMNVYIAVGSDGVVAGVWVWMNVIE